MLRIFKFLLLTSVILTLSATIAMAGKPGNNPPPPPKPVQYQPRLWTIPGSDYIQVFDTNNKLQTVGSCNVLVSGILELHAYLYDPSVDVALGIDLNLLVSNIPAGWSIRRATAINEVGQVVAYMEPIGAPLAQLQPVMIDLNQNPPVMYSVPDRYFTDYSLPGDINDWGDIVVRYRRADGTFGHYVYNFDAAAGLPQSFVDTGIITINGAFPSINNARQVVGSVGSYDGYRWSWMGSFETFSALTPLVINDDGAFCGNQTVATRKNNTNIYAFQYGPTVETYAFNRATDINSSRDLIGIFDIVHRNLGSFKVKDLLDPSDPGTAVINSYGGSLYCYSMTERDITTGFPTLAGNCGGFGVLLIPVPVP